MELATRNVIYFIILIILCLILFWYLFRYDKYIENLDEMYEIGNNCDGPFGCKTPEEVKKEGAAKLKKKQEEIAKPPSSPPNIVDISFQFTIENLSTIGQGIPYKLPEKPVSKSAKGIGAGAGAGMGAGMGMGMGTLSFDPFTHLIDTKVLSETKDRVYMLDVDPESIGFIEDASYSITTLSVNHPNEKMPTYTLNEYIPRNKSLNEIYNQKRDYIKELNKKIPICKNLKYTEYIESKDIELTVKLDKARPNNNFILITPSTNDTFPDKFKFEIINDTEKTKQSLYLWGDYMINQNKSQPGGNPNRILTHDDIINYTEKATRTIFGYNKDAFGDNCKKLDEKECQIAGIDVGNRCINIIQSGDVYDEIGDKIGSVSTVVPTETEPIQKIIVNINNGDNITGLLIYTSYLI